MKPQKKPRWNWKPWLGLVGAHVTDADALELARALPGYARSIRTRAFMCYELMYEGNAPLKHWDSRRIMPACFKLKKVGLLSACPGFGALFEPVFQEKEEGTSDEAHASDSDEPGQQGPNL